MSKYDLTELKKYTARQFFINRIEDENGKDISDTIKLTKDDQAVLANQIENLKHFKWSLENSKNLNLPNLDIISLDSSVNSSMQYAIKYHIVPPLYFKDNNYCIFSFSYSCGGLCGHGQITIYKKTGNSWKRWNHLSWWDE